MKMAKASQADQEMGMELVGAFEALGQRFCPTIPAPIQRGDREDFDSDDDAQCGRALRYLLELTERASLSRLVWGALVMLDPKNQCVDPDADTIEHHPHCLAGLAAKKARPLAEWREETGPALWWRFPVDEPPWCGTPLSDDWPHYHTHWTPLVVPDAPNTEVQRRP